MDYYTILNVHNQNEVGKWIRGLIDKGELHLFYVSKYWRRLRKEILKENNYECQECKKRGYYSKANHVHHVQWVQRHPNLALSKTYIYKGKEYNNLIPVCKKCHEEVCHPERLKKKARKESKISERWD